MQVTLDSVFTQSRELCDELAARVGTRPKLVRLTLYAALSAALYGATMGLRHSPLQAAASAVKVPALFLFTLMICLPALHFLGLLFGSPIRLGQSVGVLVAGICPTSILLSAFAPISLFFLISGTDAPFLILMHVVVFAFCGATGLVTIHRDFHQVRDALDPKLSGVATDHLLKVWMLLYMFVGTQMAYNLAPFVNRDGGPVTLFNHGHGNFYSYIGGIILEVIRR
jgi:hypothetical protein